MRKNIHPTHQEMLRRRDEVNATTNPTLVQRMEKVVLNDLFPLHAFPVKRVAPGYEVEVAE